MLHRRGLLASLSTTFATLVVGTTVYFSPLMGESKSYAKDTAKTAENSKKVADNNKKSVDNAKSSTPAKEAAAPKIEDKPFGKWTLRSTTQANGASTSYLLQQLTNEQGQSVVTVVIGNFGEKNDPVMILNLPLGISLEHGSAVKVDEKEQLSGRFSHCTPVEGCQSQFALTDAQIKDLAHGKNLTVGFVSRDNNILSTNLSLEGFSKGYEELKKANKKK